MFFVENQFSQQAEQERFICLLTRTISRAKFKTALWVMCSVEICFQHLSTLLISYLHLNKFESGSCVSTGKSGCTHIFSASEPKALNQSAGNSGIYFLHNQSEEQGVAVHWQCHSFESQILTPALKLFEQLGAPRSWGQCMRGPTTFCWDIAVYFWDS